MINSFHPQLFAEQFSADIESGDPDRVADALGKARGLLPGSRPTLPQIDDGVLDSFPDQPPWEVIQDFVWLVAHYSHFTPSMTQQDKLRLWLATILRTADGAAALQIAQYLRPVREPGADIQAALRSIAETARRGDFDASAAKGAEDLVRNLLEQRDTTKRTTDALQSWIGISALEQVLHTVTPFVPAQERLALGLGAG